MNMKKTIAAVAAGAVAVSAMATTVSALQDATLTYNLVKKYTIEQAGVATATYEFTVSGAAADITEVNFTSAEDTIKSIVVKAASSVAGEQNKIYTYSTDPNALNYNSNIVDGTLTFVEELTGYSDDVVLTITVNTETENASVGDINADIVAGTIATTTAGATPIVVKAFTGKPNPAKTVEYYAPFKTGINNNENITRFLEGNGYHNVGAVLNDAIENYETVTFTFNTATTGIAYTVSNPVTGENYFDNIYGMAGKYSDASNMTYENAVINSTNEAWQTPGSILAFYDAGWYADTSYTSFDQHLYAGTLNPYGTYTTSYASEATGYTGFDWTGYNLFQGALVINENLTMSLAETDYFDWTATSLSFDWDAIMDGAMTANDYAVYLHSMKLATSNTWYWDNLTVTLTAGAADDATSDAGVEADDEELAEEEVVEEEVVEEEVVEEEVANPTTGNASVALAVIPVALAAAAVVAKKRS